MPTTSWQRGAAGFQADAAVAEKRSRRTGEVDLGDLVTREGADLSQLGIGQIRRGVEDLDAGPLAQLESQLLDPIGPVGPNDALFGCENPPPVLLEPIDRLVDLLADLLFLKLPVEGSPDPFEASLPQTGLGDPIAQRDRGRKTNTVIRRVVVKDVLQEIGRASCRERVS